MLTLKIKRCLHYRHTNIQANCLSVEWSGKLELIKRLYQFQKLMPHINYFRASLFLFLSSFDTQFEPYLLHKCINYMLFVRVALIVICSIVFYRMFIFYKVLFVRNDIIHTHIVLSCRNVIKILTKQSFWKNIDIAYNKTIIDLSTITWYNLPLHIFKSL